MNGSNFQIPRPPFHRQNRRRQRPGARARKALSIRETHQHEFEEGRDVADDPTIWLPSEKYPPCSCVGCYHMRNYELLQAKAEEEQQEDFESEQRRLFGGDVGDDALREMGILYDVDEDSGSIIQPEARPEYYVRPMRPKRNTRASRSIQFQLPAYLAQSLLCESPEIAPWFRVEQPSNNTRPSFPTRTTIQHRVPFSRSQTPLSLPPLSPSNSVSVSVSVHSPGPGSISSDFSSPSPILFPLARDDEDLADATWDFITSSTPRFHSTTPSSEPETWILLE